MAAYRPTAGEWALVGAALLFAAVLTWGAVDFGVGYLSGRQEPEHRNPWVGLVTAAFAFFFAVVLFRWWRARFRPPGGPGAP